MIDEILENREKKLIETFSGIVENQFKQLKKDFTPAKPEDFLTRIELSKLLKISLKTVYVWSNNGILKPMKIGNRTYFSRKLVEETLFSSNK